MEHEVVSLPATVGCRSCHDLAAENRDLRRQVEQLQRELAAVYQQLDHEAAGARTAARSEEASGRPE